MSDASDWNLWLDLLLLEGLNMTTFELEFIDKLETQRRTSRNGQLRLSSGQAQLLERIHAERTP